MSRNVELRAVVTESQSKLLQEHLKSAVIEAAYKEEQHGATLIVQIRCSPSQEKFVRQILNDIGAGLTP